MTATGRADGGRRGMLALLVAAAVLLVFALGSWVLLGTDVRLPFGRQKHIVTFGISLVPDATGTLVEIVGESSDGSLPATLDLGLVTTDDAALMEGGPATGQALRYSDVRDGLGNVLPADEVRSGRLTNVGTDGRRLRLAFHVAAVAGRRIVYPIPRSPELGWVRARFYVTSATVACWSDAPGGDSAFGPCENPDSNEVDGTQHAGVRLELSTRTT